MDRQRLIVVSNRQPYEHRWESNQLVCTRTDGELTAALDPVLRRHGGTWVAWGSGSADQDGGTGYVHRGASRVTGLSATSRLADSR